jgi:hypothetical protein
MTSFPDRPGALTALLGGSLASANDDGGDHMRQHSRSCRFPFANDLGNAALFAVLLASASFASQGCAVEAPPEARRSTSSHLNPDGANGANAAGRGTLVPMYMGFADTGDWMMSRTAGEGAPAYHYNGIEFYAIEGNTNTRPAIPLYRCIDAHGTHYTSNVFACESEGSKQDGLLGYAYANDPGDGAKQIWRCISPSGRPIIATLNLDICRNGGYIVQLSLGWAYPTNVAARTFVTMNMSWSDDGDWLMSRTAGEGAPKYHFNGAEMEILDADPGDGRPVLPLYRCLDAHGTHYQSNVFACDSAGSTEESLLGWVYANNPGDGAKQIFRCIHPSGKSIVATLSPNEVCINAGFIVQGPLGWAYPAGSK